MGNELQPSSTARPSRRRGLALLIVERVLLLVALSTLGYVAGTLGGARLYQDYESRQLDAILQSGPPAADTSSVAVSRPRGVIGRIEIPRLGVSTIVKEGDDARTLDLAVGHIRGTALPGALGNIGLAGHRDTFFRRLQHIEIGDVIRLVAPEGTFTYLVERAHVVAPKDVWVLDATAEPALTLVTCYPFSYVGAAPERFIVRAGLAPASAANARVQPATWTAPVPAPAPTRIKPAQPRPSTRTATKPPAAAQQKKPAAPPPRPVWLHTQQRGH